MKTRMIPLFSALMQVLMQSPQNTAAQNCFAYYNYMVNGCTVTFNGYMNGQITDWHWDFGDGATASVQSPVHTYTSPGNYNVLLVVQDSSGSCVDSFSQVVPVSCNVYCQSGFTYNDAGGVVTFTDNSSGSAQVISWYWSFGDGSSTWQQSPVHSYANGGYYNVCLTIQTADSCQDTYCTTVYTAGQYNCIADYIYSVDSTQCKVYFQNTTSFNATFLEWDFGDGTPSGYGQNPVHAYSASGSYWVTLYAQDSSGVCYDTVSKLVALNCPFYCQAYFNYYQDSSGSFHFNEYSSGSSAVVSWHWDFGDGATSSAQYPVHTYTSPGYYQACMTITTADSCQDTWCMYVMAGSNSCAAEFDWEQDSVNVLQVHFDDQSVGSANIQTWQWDFGDGGGSSLQNPVHQYLNAGHYYVCLTITTDSCTDTWCDTVEASLTGVEERNGMRPLLVEVYPSPAAAGSVVFISVSGAALTSAGVYDILGNKVDDLAPGGKGGRELVWMAGRAGVYFIRVQAGGAYLVKQVIVAE